MSQKQYITISQLMASIEGSNITTKKRIYNALRSGALEGVKFSDRYGWRIEVESAKAFAAEQSEIIRITRGKK